MIRLKDLLNEEDKLQQLPTEIKKHFLEIISTFGQFGEQMNRKSDIRTIAETLGGIADAAQEYTLREGGDWFDRVTIKRNMKELKALHEKFQKESLEAKSQEHRMEALYEDMGHVLNRYFEIADVSEDVMRQRLGMANESKSDYGYNSVNEGNNIGHYERVGNQTIVDSNFVNNSKGIVPNSELVHLGMGDFAVKSPSGTIEFTRSGKLDGIGQDFVGRPHRMTDDKNGKLVDVFLKLMLKKKKAILSMSESVVIERALKY